jgi:hypothetical protein
LEITARMVAILRDLRAHGRAHALNELASMGYPAASTRRFATDDELEGRLRARLGQLTVKVQTAAVGLDLGDLSQDAIERALGRILGGRSIAADLVSPTFVSGLADTFEQHADLVQAWQYTAVNDAGLCDVCAPLDGEIYTSLDDLFAVLPNFGPNPDCLGGDRCRCRAVPVPPDDTYDRTVPPDDPIDWTAARALVVTEAQDAIAALETVHHLPEDAARLDVKVGAHLTPENPGRYTPTAHGGPTIELARQATDPGFTMLHEFGHYLSDTAIGATSMDAAGAAELAEWRTAVEESDAVQRLVALGRGVAHLVYDVAGDPIVVPLDPDLIFGYYLHPEELFARSYSQWAVLRSGNPTLLAQLRRMQQAQLPEQWQDHDFAAIAAAFDRLVERLGWRPGTS